MIEQRGMPAHLLIVSFVLCSMTGVCHAEPGLLGVYSDGENRVARVVPTPNFALGPRESIHSQIRTEFEATFTGSLMIERGGMYTILADADVSIGGKAVAGKRMMLTPGEHALKITYQRKPGSARLQLRWKPEFAVEEPIPPTAFVHDGADNEAAKKWASIEEGRSLFERHSCGACHGADGWMLSVGQGPNLSNIGGRVDRDWLASWLADPKQHRSTTTMPNLLEGKDEVRDVTAYLSKLVTTPSQPSPEKGVAIRIERGRTLFETIGCRKCHSDSTHSLEGVGEKYASTGALADFLVDPLHVDPSGRMPQLFDPKKQRLEAELVADYLFYTKREKALPKFVGKANSERGRKLVRSRGCVSCHSVEENGKALMDGLESPLFTTSKSTKGQIAKFDPSKGCLAETVSKGVPDFSLPKEQRGHLRAFLGSMKTQPVVAEAPVERFHRRVEQMNCTACHELNHKSNGPVVEMTEDGRIITIEHPPTLTGVGGKLRPDWIRKVLLEKKRTRPWMKMRMPHFGKEMAEIVGLFAKASGSPTTDPSPKPSADLAKAGLETIGIERGKVACIACHNYRGIDRQQEGVVSAPDLAEVGETLRHDWFRRWMRNPTRITPHTSMPQLFLELKVAERDRKIEELWSALVHQSTLPLPKGLLEETTKGTRIIVADEPVVFRVAAILPNKQQVHRAINVGLPGGLNFTFDARTARLRYAWKGEFVEAGPAWNGRGGKPVFLHGRPLFAESDHFPIRIGSSDNDPSVQFRGYSLEKKHPVFRYLVDGVEVHERIDLTETELVREYRIADPTKAIYFVSEKGRSYSSKIGKFDGEVLKVAPKKGLVFELRSKISAGKLAVQQSLKWHPIDSEKAPISQNGVNMSVLFENKSGRRVKIKWVGYDGKIRLYGELAPGKTRSQNTYARNTWLITDENDKPMGYFVVEGEQVARAVIPRK